MTKEHRIIDYATFTICLTSLLKKHTITLKIEFHTIIHTLLGITMKSLRKSHEIMFIYHTHNHYHRNITRLRTTIIYIDIQYFIS